MQSVTNVKIIYTKYVEIICTEYIAIRGKIYLTTTPVAIYSNLCVSPYYNSLFRCFVFLYISIMGYILQVLKESVYCPRYCNFNNLSKLSLSST